MYDFLSCSSHLVKFLLHHRDACEKLRPLRLHLAQVSAERRRVHLLQPQQLVTTAEDRRAQGRLRVHFFGEFLKTDHVGENEAEEVSVTAW